MTQKVWCWALGCLVPAVALQRGAMLSSSGFREIGRSEAVRQSLSL